jgi:ketosteroid isomerase-like protein
MSNTNEQIIEKFYSAFQKKDAKTMNECYADDIDFNDPVFSLKGNSAKAMWSMLCERAVNFSLSFSNIKADDSKGSADWIATYDFSKTGRKIVNHIHAEFIFKDGKIVKHTDSFNLWKWAGMALGAKGFLLGFLPAVQNKIKNEANTGLQMFMKRNKIKP